MVASPAPVVRLVRHRAINWPVAERIAMARKLEALGSSITELSDARERLCLCRLSVATREDRASAHQLLTTERGQRALANIRQERAMLLEALGTLPRAVVSEAVLLLRLRGGRAQWRLGELMAVFSQARILEIEREAWPTRVSAQELEPSAR
jgi:hypothetical protein